MHFSTIAVAVLASTAYWMPAVALVVRDEDGLLAGMSVARDEDSSVDLTGTTEAQNEAHNFVELDLEDYEARHNGTLTIESRTDVKACFKALKTTTNCIGAVTSVAGLGVSIKALAVSMKGASDAKSCSIHTGAVDNFSWRYYATGKNCDTTAEEATIQGALDEFVESTSGKNICGVSCIKLTHGGTWTGYVTLAGPHFNPSAFYCGASDKFGSCKSGGKNNVTANPKPHA